MLGLGRSTVLVAALALPLNGCSLWRAWQRSDERPPAAAAVQPASSDVSTENDPERLYGLGVEALVRDDLDTTIAAWRRYAVLAPAGQSLAREVRGHLTLLEREAAKRFAKRAAAGERSGMAPAADPLRVALFPLRPQGPNAAVDPFHRALLAMLTADLAKVPALTLLERERVDALLDELGLARSGLVDPGTLQAPARLLGAGTVVAGSVRNEPGPAGPGSGLYGIATAVTDVRSGRVLATPETDGRQAEFFVLEKRIVHGILDALDVRERPPGVDRIHTRSWEAYARFANGLALLSQDRFDEARFAFRAALAADAGFGLAADALAATPAQPASLAQIRAAAAAARRR